MTKLKPSDAIDLELDVDEDDKTLRNISGIAVVDRFNGIFLVDDEATHVRFLRRDGNGFRERSAARVNLAKKLPPSLFDIETEISKSGKEKPKEMDLEGLSFDATMGRLWFIGSHARTRDKAAEKQGRIGALQRSRNRLALGFMRFEGDAVSDPSFADIACLRMKDGETALSRLMAQDKHVGPFAGLSTKENGVDVEGIAARGNTLFVGLRGPVLADCAVILRVRFTDIPTPALDSKELTIASCEAYFLRLDGLGVRDLVLDGDDLLILTGGTMRLQGVSHLWRWHDAVGSAAPASDTPLLDSEREQLGAIDTELFEDAPECCDFVRIGGNRRLLVVRDGPDNGRIAGNTYRAELYPSP